MFGLIASNALLLLHCLHVHFAVLFFSFLIPLTRPNRNSTPCFHEMVLCEHNHITRFGNLKNSDISDVTFFCYRFDRIVPKLLSMDFSVLKKKWRYINLRTEIILHNLFLQFTSIVLFFILSTEWALNVFINRIETI